MSFAMGPVDLTVEGLYARIATVVERAVPHHERSQLGLAGGGCCIWWGLRGNARADITVKWYPPQGHPVERLCRWTLAGFPWPGSGWAACQALLRQENVSPSSNGARSPNALVARAVLNRLLAEERRHKWVDSFGDRHSEIMQVVSALLSDAICESPPPVCLPDSAAAAQGLRTPEKRVASRAAFVDADTVPEPAQ